MFTALRKFIVKIQNSDEATKKLWLVILSGTAMLMVVIIWVINLNFKFKQTNAVAENQPVLEKQKTSIKEIFSAGFMAIAAAVKEKLPTGQEFSIKNSDRNFVLEKLQTAPKIPLP